MFDYFTKPEAIVKWMGDRAVLDPRPGGEFTLFIAGTPVRGRYLEVDPPRRVVISWGRDGSTSFPPGTSTLEVTLIPDRGGDHRAHRPHRPAGAGAPQARDRVGALPWTARDRRRWSQPGPDPWETSLPKAVTPDD